MTLYLGINSIVDDIIGWGHHQHHSLNVSGYSTLNNTTLISTLNVSSFTTLNNNRTLSSSLNVSGSQH